MKTRRLKILLVSYLIVVVWITVFKFSVSWQEILNLVNSSPRSINLIPFGSPTQVNGSISFKEIVYNLLIFIPFGGLLGLVSKKTNVIQKISIIFFFSLFLESLQFIFSLGAADITDIIQNSIGGMIGLLIYNVFAKRFTEVVIDPIFIKIGSILFSAAFLLILMTFI